MNKSLVGGQQRILVTGATGYIGGRLLRRLEKSGCIVRCLARRPRNLRARLGRPMDVVRGDVLDPASLTRALEGVSAAYYLVHSMGSADGFEERDRLGAQNFAAAAKAAGVGRIIYLGGLGSDEDQLSSHLRSRNEVGTILRASGVPTIEFRASIVLGRGSLSFEMIRSLVDRLPVMVTPSWVRVKAQPIAIGELLDYLQAGLDIDLPESRVFEIGGSDQVSYGDLMREYARQRGLKRPMLPLPVLTPWLSSLWLGLVTPLYARIGRKLIASIQNPTVIRDHSAQEVFGLVTMNSREAIAAALAEDGNAAAESVWFDALSSGGAVRIWAGSRLGNRVFDARQAASSAPVGSAFAPVRRLGGENGWYAYTWLWKIRGGLDLLFGGVGMRRGRRHPEIPTVGDALDFWRVQAYEPDRLLRLVAEMKVPGQAWLEFRVEPEGTGSRLRQTAVFHPSGVFGYLYWYALFPVHQLVFGGMLRRIVELGEAEVGLASSEEFSKEK